MEGDGLGFLDEWAGEWGDDGASRVGHGLSVFGVRPTQDVPGILNDGVLEATAGPEKGPIAPTGELNAFQHAIETFIGTAWRCPESVKALQFLLCFGSEDAWGSDPLRFEAEIQLRRSVLK